MARREIAVVSLPAILRKKSEEATMRRADVSMDGSA